MKNVERVLSCLIVITLLVGSLKCLTDIMERKTSDIKYQDFFAEKENFDILFMGSSHVINGVFPMELWRDYGIVSYNFGGHGNQIATSYWVMENALDYTTPKLMVIDCFNLDEMVKTTPIDFAYLHQSFDAFPLSINKIKAANDLLDDSVAVEQRKEFEVKENPTVLGILWNFSVYHSRWNDISVEDFQTKYSNEKGAELRIGIAVPNENDTISPDLKLENDTLAEEYLCKIIEECQKRGIEVLLTYLPYPANVADQMDANKVKDIAKQYNVGYINFLTENVVDYQIDCYDEKSHLNPSGARKVTAYLGSYIQEHYNIPDQRNNLEYAHWNKNYDDYLAYKIEEIKDVQELDVCLMVISDKDFDILIDINDKQIFADNYYLRLLTNLGVDATQLNENTDFIVIDGKEKNVSYLNNFKKSGSTSNTALGKFTLWSSDEDCKEYGMYLGEHETLTTTSEKNGAINIAVIDRKSSDTVATFYFPYK